MAEAFDLHRDLPQWSARFGLLILCLAIPAEGLAQVGLWLFAALLAVGVFSGLAAVTGFSLAVWVLAQRPFDPPLYLLVLAMAPVVRRVRIRGPGPWALDPLPFHRWFPRAHATAKQRGPGRMTRWLRGYYRDYQAFDLRYTVAFALVPAGLWFALRPLPGWEALGWAWMLAGTLLVLGVATPWTSVASAAVLLLGIPATGSWAWLGLALAALACAFVDDDRLSLDLWFATRGRGGVRARRGRIAVLAPRGGQRQA